MTPYEKKLMRQMNKDLKKYDKTKGRKTGLENRFWSEKENYERLYYKVYLDNLMGYRIVNRAIEDCVKSIKIFYFKGDPICETKKSTDLMYFKFNSKD